MARQKKPQNETQKEANVRRMLEVVANNANRSEKTSWNRKQDNMVKLMSELRPIEERILALMADKNVIIDKINMLRQVMVNECIHPYEHLVYHDNHIVCKFCNKRLSIPGGFEDATEEDV